MEEINEEEPELREGYYSESDAEQPRCQDSKNQFLQDIENIFFL